MSTETYDFWKMILHSPVAIAVLTVISGITGSLVTLLVASLRNNHERRMKLEEKYFDLKLEAYKTIFKLIEEIRLMTEEINEDEEENKDENSKKFLSKIQSRITEVLSYSSLFVPDDIYIILKDLNENIDNVISHTESFSEENKEETDLEKVLVDIVLLVKNIQKLSTTIRTDIQKTCRG